MFDLDCSNIKISRVDVSASYKALLKNLVSTDLPAIRKELEQAIIKLDKDEMIGILKRFQHITSYLACFILDLVTLRIYHIESTTGLKPFTM